MSYKDIFFTNEFDNIKLEGKPNILHIVPDGLMNLNYLNDQDLKFFVKNTLRDLEIDIFEKSLTNYPTTFLSLSSSLNGSLINEKIEFEENHFNRFIYNSSFHEFLKNHDYDIFWYRTDWIGSRCNDKSYNCMNQKFYNNEIVKNYLRLMNFNYFWFEKIFYIISKKVPFKHLDIVYNDLDEIMNNNFKTKYIFAYLNIPHSPFTVDENCYPISLTEIDQNIFTEKEYFKQTKCLFKQIQNLLIKLQNKNKDFLIIIQSDTGWIFKNIPSKEKPDLDWPDNKFKNFIAVSNHYNCLDPKKKISNADILPMIMSCLTNKKINLRNNSTFNAYYSDHPRTGKIFSRDTVNFD